MTQTREIIYDKMGNVVHVASKGKTTLRTLAVPKVPSMKKSNGVYLIDETDTELDKFYITSSTPVIREPKKMEEKKSLVTDQKKIQTTTVDIARQMNYPLSMFQNIQLRWRMRGPRN